MLLKSTLKNSNWIHKLFSPLSQIYLTSSSKWTPFSHHCCLPFCPRNKSLCLNLIHGSAVELTRSTVGVQEASGLASFLRINIRDNHNDLVSSLDFKIKTLDQVSLPSVSSHPLHAFVILKASCYLSRKDQSVNLLKGKDEDTRHITVCQESIWYSIQANDIW